MRLSVLRRGEAPQVEPPAGAPRPPWPWRRWLRWLRWRYLRASLRHNPGLKLTALLLAFFLWFSINVTERDAERVVEVPVTIRKLQVGLIVTNPPLKPVTITLRGPRTILDGIDEHRSRIPLDLAGAGPGDERLELNTDMVKPELPRRVKIVRMEPARVKLRVERVVRRTLPVRTELAGVPAFGYTVADTHVVPDHVEVTGPATKVDELKDITTEPIDLRGLKDVVERSALLAWAGDFVSFVPDHIVVTIGFEPVLMSRDFRHVDVRVVNAGAAETQLTPPWADVTVRGPQALLHNFGLSGGAVYVDAAGLGPGTHRVSARFDLPPAIEVVHHQPEVHTLVIGKAATGGR